MVGISSPIYRCKGSLLIRRFPARYRVRLARARRRNNKSVTLPAEYLFGGVRAIRTFSKRPLDSLLPPDSFPVTVQPLCPFKSVVGDRQVLFSFYSILLTSRPVILLQAHVRSGTFI